MCYKVHTKRKVFYILEFPTDLLLNIIQLHLRNW